MFSHSNNHVSLVPPSCLPNLITSSPLVVAICGVARSAVRPAAGCVGSTTKHGLRMKQNLNWPGGPGMLQYIPVLNIVFHMCGVFCMWLCVCVRARDIIYMQWNAVHTNTSKQIHHLCSFRHMTMQHNRGLMTVL